MFLFFFNDERMDANTLADYVLKKAAEKEIAVTNLKLQRILYYVQGHYLAKFGHPLFPDEIHAWKTGPVVPNVYFTFSKYGPDPLRMRKEPDMRRCPSDELALIDSVISDKLNISASELSFMARRTSPWSRAISRRVQLIELDKIKEFFEQKE